MNLALILAGGRGTRSADPGTPKVCVPIGRKPLLQHHFDLLSQSEIRKVIVAAGVMADQVVECLARIDKYAIDIEVVIDSKPTGTMNAIRNSVTSAFAVESDELLVISGDVLTSFDINGFSRKWKDSRKPVAVVTHPSTHPGDSDSVFQTYNGRVYAAPKGSRHSFVPNMSSTGVFAVRRQALLNSGDCIDFGADLVPMAANRDQLFAHISSHYFKDTGTPSRLVSARIDYSSGVFHRRGSLEPRRAIFLDRDGVINPDSLSTAGPANYDLEDGVAEAIARANQLGVPVFVVTNQPAIAKGFITESEHEATRAKMDQLLAEAGAFVDDYEYCPHHPERGFIGEIRSLKVVCECRKPSTGLIDRLSLRHNIDVGKSILIGDSWREKELARRAGCQFLYVSNFHHSNNDFEVLTASNAIDQALEMTLC